MGARRRCASALAAGLVLAAGGITVLQALAQGDGATPPDALPVEAAVPAEDVAPLMAEAARLSGLPPLPAESVPRVWSVSEAVLHATVCRDEGEHCHGLQAVYDTELNRVLVLEWGRQRGAEWESFVLHEFVHALQYAREGDRMFGDCASRRASEQLAYGAQDAYLQRRGVLLRVSSQMWWWQCPDEVTRPAARNGPGADTP